MREDTDLVRIQIENRFYKRLEETAERLKTTPDKLIYNAIS
jgi:predicted DNA-binding ribbon-helix-helix protein